jgi:WD40 repeat protein
MYGSPLRALLFVPSTLVLAFLGLVAIVAAQQPSPELALQSGHRGQVHSLAFSPDGRMLASAGSDSTIKLWDTSRGLLIRTLSGHLGAVRAVAFSPDGKSLVSGSQDHTIRIWDLETGRAVKSFEEQRNLWVTGVAYSVDGKSLLSVARITDDLMGQERLPKIIGAVRVWDVASGRAVRTMPTNGASNSLSFSPDTGVLYTSTGQLWDPAAGKLISQEYRMGAGAESAALSRNGSILAVVNGYGLDIWDTKRLEVVHPIRDLYLGGIDRMTLKAVAIGPDGELIAVGDDKGRVGLWSAASGKSLQVVEEATPRPYDEVSAIAFAPDGTSVAAASMSGKIRIWQLRNRQLEQVRDFQVDQDFAASSGGSSGVPAQQRIAKGHPVPIEAVAFDPQGRTMVTGGNDGIIRVWDLRQGQLASMLEGHPGAIRELSYSPDGQHLASSSAGDPREGTLRVWNTKTWKQEGSYEAHMIRGVAFHPDGRTVAWSGSESDLLNLADGTKKRVCGFRFTGDFPFVALAPDGKLGAIGVGIGRESKEEVCLFDGATGAPVRILAGHADDVLVGKFSPDGKTFASAGRDRLLKLWDVESGHLLRTISGHQAAIRSLAFSQTGAIIATGSADHLVKLWDTKTGKLMRTLNGHTAAVASLAFGPEGRTIATGGEDGTTQIWETASGDLLLTLVAFDDGQWIVYSPSGYYYCSSEGSKYVDWRIGNTMYAFDQFFEKFYTPDLFERVMQGKLPRAEARSATAAPPPDVLILRPRPDQVFTDPEVEVSIQVRDLGGGVDEVRFYQNGKQVVQETARTESQPPGTVLKTFKLTLLAGDNVLRATAFSSDRTESTPHQINIQLQAPKKVATLRLLSIGVSRYKNPALNLSFPALDAGSLVTFFKGNGSRLFREIDATELLDQDATEKNVMQAFESLERRSLPEDVVIIFLAGHGDTLGNQWYFVPQDLAEPEKELELSTHGISTDRLNQELKRIPSRKILLLIDACYSGSLLSSFRGYEDRKALSLLARSVGIHILAASSRDQRASEVMELRHGVFSYLLLKGLGGDAVLRAADHEVTVLGLASYLRNQLPDFGKKYNTEEQDPVSYSNGMDFPIVLLP